MKIPKMLESNPPTNAEAIASFEAAWKLTLPADYKRFLTATNGGVPESSVFPLRGRPLAPEDNVQNFLGIGVPGLPTSELSYPIGLYAGGLPDLVVPIANQDLGSYVCLDLRTGRARVTFWDHRHFWGTGEWREQDLYHIADSFEEFLGLLRPNAY